MIVRITDDIDHMKIRKLGKVDKKRCKNGLEKRIRKRKQSTKMAYIIVYRWGGETEWRKDSKKQKVIKSSPFT